MIPKYAAICWNLDTIKKIQGDSDEEPMVPVREEAFNVEPDCCFLGKNNLKNQASETLEEEK